MYLATLPSIGGIVLCGGRSERMGRPKEWLDIDGKTMLVRVVHVVAEVADPVVVAARPGQSLPTLPAGVTIVHDEIPGQGPLAGLVAGLAALAGRCDAAFVTGCDHPWLTPEFIRALADRLEGFEAAAMVVDGHPRPLPAVYRLAVGPRGQAALARGELRVARLLASCRANLLTLEDLPPAVDGRAALANVNRPEDLDPGTSHHADP